MKKRLLFFLSVLLFPYLNSCHSNSSNNKILLKKAENVSTLFFLSSAEQLRSLTRYEDCVILVSLEGCHYCENERSKIQQYVKETSCVIYEIDQASYTEAYDDESNSIGQYAFSYPFLTGYPTYLFYKDGKLKNSKAGALGNDYDSFRKEMDNQVDILNLYMVNDYVSYTTPLDISYHYWRNIEEYDIKQIDTFGYSTEEFDKKKKAGKNTFLISWKRCSDCSSLKKEVLDDYLFENPEKRIYVYEVDGYFLTKRSKDATLSDFGLTKWRDFSLENHLISEDFYFEDKNGNKAGVVPTLLTFEDEAFLNADVYLNESDIFQNDDGTLSYGKAFHKECLKLKSDRRVSSMDTSSEDYLSAVKELSKKAKDIDKKKARAYLNENL